MTEKEIQIAIERAIVSLDLIDDDIDRILDAGCSDDRRDALRGAWYNILEAAVVLRSLARRDLD